MELPTDGARRSTKSRWFLFLAILVVGVMTVALSAIAYRLAHDVVSLTYEEQVQTTAISLIVVAAVVLVGTSYLAGKWMTAIMLGAVLLATVGGLCLSMLNTDHSASYINVMNILLGTILAIGVLGIVGVGAYFFGQQTPAVAVGVFGCLVALALGGVVLNFTLQDTSTSYQTAVKYGSIGGMVLGSLLLLGLIAFAVNQWRSRSTK